MLIGFIWPIMECRPSRKMKLPSLSSSRLPQSHAGIGRYGLHIEVSTVAAGDGSPATIHEVAMVVFNTWIVSYFILWRPTHSITPAEALWSGLCQSEDAVESASQSHHSPPTAIP